MMQPVVGAHAAERLAEIQAVATQWGLPDATWAEILIDTPAGVWTQAFELRDGRARALTVPAFVPARRD